MDTNTQIITNLLETMVNSLIDNTDDCKISCESGKQTISYCITCDEEDRGKLIGKKGYVANLIRNFVKIVGKRYNKKIDNITIIE